MSEETGEDLRFTNENNLNVVDITGDAALCKLFGSEGVGCDSILYYRQ